MKIKHSNLSKNSLINSQFLKTITIFVIAIFFLFQPMITYLTNYDPGDCDDKAVQYFSAAYFTTPAENRLKLQSLLQQTVKKYQNSPSWERTNFRLQGVNTYPITNLTITAFHQVRPDFNDSVKLGLATITIIALLLAVWLSSKTLFGFWQSVLVINLVAFYSIKLNFIASQIPRNMHPFITYVPRGGAALLILPIVLAFAAKKPFLFLTSVLLVFLVHTGVGVQILVLTFFSTIIFIIAEKYKLTGKPVAYLLLPITLLGGLTTFVASVALGLILYLYSKKIKIKNSDFYNRVFVFGIFTLATTIVSAGLLTNPIVSKPLSNYLASSIIQELPQRFDGIKYVLVVLLTVVSSRLVFNFLIAKKYFVMNAKAKNLFSTTLIIAILTFLTLNHLTEYQWVAKRATGFFFKTCQITPLQLPQESNKLMIENEPQFFMSLGNYLFLISQKP